MDSVELDKSAKRELLRHALATVAYRAGKTIRSVPSNFSQFTCGQEARTPAQILAHVGDLMEWALSIGQGRQRWSAAPPLPWDQECERFFSTLQRLDDFLASSAELHTSPEKLLQAPIADALTHVGQLAMLRRLAESPIKGENYFVAEIVAGRVGAEQASPKNRF